MGWTRTALTPLGKLPGTSPTGHQRWSRIVWPYPFTQHWTQGRTLTHTQGAYPMGRRAAAIEIDASVEAGKPPEEAGGEDAASLFDASGDARVRIMRRDNTSQKMVTHGYFPPTVKEEDVANAFGGGHYRAQLVIPDPASGLAKVKAGRDFYIPGAYKPPAKITTFEDAGPNGPMSNPQTAAASVQLPVPTGGDDLMAVLKAGIINTLLEMMKTTREAAKAPGTDPLLLEFLRQQAEDRKAATEMQFKMMEFMLKNSNQPTGNSRAEVLDELAKFKEVLGGTGGNNMDTLKTMIETFREFRDAAEDVASPHGTGDPIMDSIPKLVEVVAEQHQLNKQARTPQAPRQIPVPPSTTPQVNTLPMPEIPVWKQVLRSQGKKLLASAIAGHDAEVIAGTAILFAPPHIKAALTEFFHRDEPEVMADILAEIPEMANHREWLSDFVNNAQFRLFPDEFNDDEGVSPVSSEDIADATAGEGEGSDGAA